MEKVHMSFMKELRNISFFALFELLIKRVDAEKTENATLKKATERMKKHNKELTLLRETKPRHPLTQVITKKVRNRTEYLACLRLKVDANLLSHKPDERIAAERLKIWLHRYKKDLYAPSIDSQGELVKFMMDERANHVDILNATKLLQLDELLEAIMEITVDIDRIYMERLKDKNYKSVKGQEIRAAAYNDLQLLIQVIEVSYNLSADELEKVKLKRLNKEIIGYLRSFNTQLKSRRTKTKNKKELAETVNELATTTKENSNKYQKGNNLPMIIYEHFKKESSLDLQNNSSTNTDSHLKTNSLPEYEDRATNKKGKEIREIGDNGGLPPIR